MNFHILTLFPEMVMNGLNTSIIGRAVNAGHLSIEAVNIRDYAFNKHQSGRRLSVRRRSRNAHAGGACISGA